MSFLSRQDLENMNFKKLGSNVLISSKASFYGCEYMEIGDNTRIDDFCVLSGAIVIGKHVHIATHCAIMSGVDVEIKLGDYSGLSFGCKVFAKSDDFSGNFMTNPTVPSEFTNVASKSIYIKKHVIIGASSVILPGVTVNEGAAIGAISVVHKDLDAWSIYCGNPIRKIKDRKNGILKFENELNKLAGKNVLNMDKYVDGMIGGGVNLSTTSRVGYVIRKPKWAS